MIYFLVLCFLLASIPFVFAIGLLQWVLEVTLGIESNWPIWCEFIFTLNDRVNR